MKRTLLLPICAALIVQIYGCGEKAKVEANPAPSIVAQQPAATLSIESVASNTHGFNAGNVLSARKIYIFFDPQCPHCGELWKAAKPLQSSAHFIWIPVGLLTPEKSALQSAYLLGSQNAVREMDDHEALLDARKGGLEVSAAQTPENAVSQVKANTEYFLRLNLDSVPFAVYQGPGGEMLTFSGALTTDALKERLGI